MLFLYDEHLGFAGRLTLPMESRFACMLDVKASLGECPVWSVDEQALYWVDINAPSLNRFDPATPTQGIRLTRDENGPHRSLEAWRP